VGHAVSGEKSLMICLAALTQITSVRETNRQLDLLIPNYLIRIVFRYWWIQKDAGGLGPPWPRIYGSRGSVNIILRTLLKNLFTAQLSDLE